MVWMSDHSLHIEILSRNRSKTCMASALAPAMNELNFSRNI